MWSHNLFIRRFWDFNVRIQENSNFVYNLLAFLYQLTSLQNLIKGREK